MNDSHRHLLSSLIVASLIAAVLTIALVVWVFLVIQHERQTMPAERVESTQEEIAPPSAIDPCLLESVHCEGEIEPDVSFGALASTVATVTAYSRVDGCDDAACIMASGKEVYVGAAACPRRIPFGTKLLIGGQIYTCEDRTAKKFDGRYDIFMDSHTQALQWGRKVLEVQTL